MDVPLPGQSYTVAIGSGVRNALRLVLGDLRPGKVVIAARKGVVGPGGPRLRTDGVPAEYLSVEDGEAAKSLAGVEAMCRAFAQKGLTRLDVVVAVGGGTVTDTVGLAAALYHRGTAVIHLPTTLLAQIDASVGGKTGVNLPEGKNLVGAYWHPAAVLCDTDFLSTLPARQWRSGLGEIARCQLVGGVELGNRPLEEQIASAIAMKTDVVVRDERDHGARTLLNYGHTLGHALELATGYELTHGEAVAVGMIFAALIAEEMSRIPRRRVIEHYDIIGGYGLHSTLPGGVSVPALIELMLRDKKARGALTLVLDGKQGMEVVPGIPTALADRVLQRMVPGAGEKNRR
ncbi:3-dehydroquinate synthase family protein [Streptomyces sp. OE57]|uniref:3-dehydroquinate synthase n=1 Tax=Streptomyces lacaronensis TaxID=3379885 RepID=UPI0039B785DA